MGLSFYFEGSGYPVALTELTGGKSVMAYGQTEVTLGFNGEQRADCGAPVIYGVSDVTIQDAKNDRRLPSSAAGNPPPESQ